MIHDPLTGSDRPRLAGRWLAGIVMTAVFMSPAHTTAAVATSWERLYDDALLQRTVAAAQAALNDNLHNFILPSVRPEHRRLAQGIQIVIQRSVMGSHPLNAYASASEGKVIISAATLRLFGDLLYAWAWLGDNGHSPETVLAYLSMLKYQYAGQRQVDRSLNPLTVLGIPANVRDNPKLAAQVDWQFNSAMFFILSHEVGHIVLGHRVLADGLTPSASRDQETAADAFALEIMHSIGQTPEGLVYYFLFTSVLEWFAVDGHIGTAPYRTHPVSVERIKAMTDYIRKNAAGFARVQTDTRRGQQYFLAVADQVETAVRGVLDGDPAQRRWREIGRASTPRNLGPRPPIQTASPVFRTPGAVLGPPQSQAAARADTVVGRWIDNSSILHRAYYDLRADNTYSFVSLFHSLEPKMEIEVREEGTYTTRADQLTITPRKKVYIRDGVQQPDALRERSYQWAVASASGGGRILNLAADQVRFTFSSE